MCSVPNARRSVTRSSASATLESSFPTVARPKQTPARAQPIFGTLSVSGATGRIFITTAPDDEVGVILGRTSTRSWTSGSLGAFSKQPQLAGLDLVGFCGLVGPTGASSIPFLVPSTPRTRC